MVKLYKHVETYFIIFLLLKNNFLVQLYINELFLLYTLPGFIDV